ncbi:MAG: N-acetylmuramoyl-L-alanine amidase [Bacteroidales bacterium]|nr:N-acetylmuramoyl-L-alanine amidase [Bacteroidales bacterium]
MNIISVAYSWAKPLVKRDVTNYIILHQRAGWGDVASIHSLHLGYGYSGIGYNFYVRLDGSVYAGRPIDVQGAHAENNNWQSVGICAEGYYCLPPTGSAIRSDQINRTMPEAQKKALTELVAYCRGIYPGAKVIRHSDVNATNCPGEFYPFDEIAAGATADPSAVTIKAGGQTFPGVLIDNVTYAPVRKVAEALGRQVGWDGNTRTVSIS